MSARMYLIELRMVKEFSSTVPIFAAISQPETPAIAAEIPKASVLVWERLTPITAAAVSLSRTATNDRPDRLLRKLRTMT